MIFDQIMCLKLVLWRKVYFKRMRAIFISCFVVIFFFIVNLHLNFTVKCVENQNCTNYYISPHSELSNWLNVSNKKSICNFFYNIRLFKVHGYIYFVLPLCSLISFAAHLFYLVKIKKINNNICKNNRLKSKIFFSSIRHATFFLLFKLPFVIIGKNTDHNFSFLFYYKNIFRNVFFDKLNESQEGRMIVSCGIIINFLPNFFYFVNNMFENKKFRIEFKDMICSVNSARHRRSTIIVRSSVAITGSKRFSSIRISFL